MLSFENDFHGTPVWLDLSSLYKNESFDLFIANQVLWNFVKKRIVNFYELSPNTKRIKRNILIAFKDKGDLDELFKPFEKFLIYFYTFSILLGEGEGDHKLFIGIKSYQ